ncbi:glycosyltransferase [Pararhizobium sp. LjRoot235]|uniref:glycosyltransferase n=1 Tax=Pararhizobium sp. LjRoot235 TaxID=3342291 RepID=UPI003ECF551F
MLKNPFKSKKKTRTDDSIALADHHNRLKQWESAARFYRAALKIDGNRSSIWVQLGHMEKERGLAEEASLAYQTAIAKDPANPDARLHLGHLLKSQGDLIGAFDQLSVVYESTRDLKVEDELRRLMGTTKSYDAFISAIEDTFDEEFYLKSNPDVAKSGVNPKIHYIVYGWRERRKAAETHYTITSDPFTEARPVKNSEEWIALSVVIPTYNRAALLEKTLRRLLDIVRDDPVEIVVVDDGSTDNTPDILAVIAFQNAKLTYKSVKNAGPGSARNIGATLTRGEIILFLGDDTQPVNSDLFRAHYQAHMVNKDLGHAVLGKIIWPDDKITMPNAVMSLIQGDGQQQFGYKFMKPWQKYGPWLFYTANVSVKRNIINNWHSEGFDQDFTLYGFEDSEFAYRMSKLHGNFGVFYTPNAIVEHYHEYNTAGFMRRQVACGMMIDVLVRKHPELETLVLGPDLSRILKTEHQTHVNQAPTHYYSTMIEGIRAWALVIDHHYGLGSQNWHPDFLSAVFRLSLLDSYIMLQGENPTAQAAAYRYLISDFRMQMGRAVANELLGDFSIANLI